MITVKGVEDLKILFEAFGDFGPDDGCVHRTRSAVLELVYRS
jgi:hypothetical protein